MKTSENTILWLCLLGIVAIGTIEQEMTNVCAWNLFGEYIAGIWNLIF